MRFVPIGAAIVAALISGLALALFAANQDRGASSETENYYIYGSPRFYHFQKSFGGYLEPIAAEGLHEIRSDHKPRVDVGSSATSVTTASTSSFTVISCSNGSGSYPVIIR